MAQGYVADFSLALINRTGAYYVGRDLLGHVPGAFSGTRYWRLRRSREPQGLLRRLLGKAMLFELSHPALWPAFPRWDAAASPGQRTLYLDPLYVLRSRLSSADLVLCHDVGPVSMPHFFEPATSALYRRAYEAIGRAKPGLVFVSKTSRAAFIELFGSDFPVLEVIPLYVRPGCEGAEIERPAGVEEPFLLTVGALELRKNYPRTIEAFNMSGLRERGYSYVLCGAQGNRTREIRDLVRRSPNVIELGYPSDAELRWLYRHASGFVLASLLEGFGMPALEAAQHGLLSVISHDGALREAVGDAAVLVDPMDPESIAAGMASIVDMSVPERMARLSEARRHAADLTLDRYASRWSDLLAAC